MQIDKSKLNSLAKLDDETLKKTITQTATQCGADTRKISASLSDMGKLRATLMTLSEKDIEKILRAVGPENAQIIADNIKKLP